MIPSSHGLVLRTLVDRLGHMKQPWAITGSLGFALHGMDVQVNDIDLQTNREGAYEIQERFEAETTREVEFSEAPNVRSYFGGLNIGGIQVEIMGHLKKRLPSGEWEPPVDVDQFTQWVEFEDLKLPVLALEYEASAYRLLGRTDQADAIRRWLER